MTTTNIIARKKQSIERRKALLSSQERMIKELERKQRTRRLIELGGLIVKAGLAEIQNDVLLGALLTCNEQFDHQKDAWQQKGAAIFKKEQQDKTAVIVSFTEKPSADFRTQLREHGLKWNRIRGEWQGLVILGPLTELLSEVAHELEIVQPN